MKYYLNQESSRFENLYRWVDDEISRLAFRDANVGFWRRASFATLAEVVFPTEGWRSPVQEISEGEAAMILFQSREVY